MSGLHNEGVPLAGTLRMVLLLAALTPAGGQTAEVVTEAVVGPLLAALTPALATCRSIVRSGIALASAASRTGLEASFLTARAGLASTDAGLDAGPATAAACRLERLADAVRDLRRRREAQDLLRPLAAAWSSGPDVTTGIAGAAIEAAADEDERHATPAAAEPRRRALVDCDWDGPVLPEPRRHAGAEDEEADAAAAAASESDVAASEGIALLGRVFRAATAVRESMGGPGRRLSADPAGATDLGMGGVMVSPQHARDVARAALRRRFGPAADFASPRTEDGKGGRARASVSSFMR